MAESFGYKRVYLAGDATHQCVSIGGLGMNNVIAEAHNLAWKLAAVMNDWGGRALIGSYEAGAAGDCQHLSSRGGLKRICNTDRG